ncbi:PadR family transcriptional regulator, regulatory protein PadR [Sanguibacter gelidistatuariae]|uniref:PadR family transcriptional regulator, regulatory protein PadR n=1 Tax=Sanguibacter gelidistatuariae TaxID=1814289 RepID=A0A1G6KJI8_9MICO|nr:PadR family transcriptional regulator [Sanguibacter gelidistatuariae]SDC30715.1 PadR family transcriptional regulator, regulatory protein PadR [Sanguibacter gelidistatuariae]
MSIHRDPQLLKGILPTLVLALLRTEESYGYELVTRLQAGGLTDVATGTVYPILTRLEREGAITSRLVASSSGPARKYYAPTLHGAVRLAQGLAAWNELSEIVNILTPGEI